MSDPMTKSTLIHQEAVSDMHARILAIVAERLPNVGTATVKDRRRISTVAAIPDDFLLQIVDAIVEKPEAGAMNNITPDEVHDTIAFSSEYVRFAEQMEAIGRNVRAIVASKRFDLGQRALGVYGVFKSVDRPGQALSKATTLRRALGRSGRRKKSDAPPPLTDSQRNP
jgi:hypothetical protein